MNETPLAALRKELLRLNLDGFVVPRADETSGRICPRVGRAPRLADRILPAARASAVVLAAKAAVFTDGRYVLQLAEQTDAALWEAAARDGAAAGDLAESQHAGGCADRLRPVAGQRGVARAIHQGGLAMTPVPSNRWTPCGRTGQPRRAPRRHRIHSAPRAGPPTKNVRTSPPCCGGEADTAVLSDPASVAWLFT